MMIEYNPAVGWQQQGGKGKQQTRYKAPGKGLRGPLSRAGGGGCKGNPKAWRSQRRTQLQRGQPKINILYNSTEKGRTCRGDNQRKQV